MTPQLFTEKLKEVCGPRLKSVILHGSAAAGDHTGRRSDYNVLVVLESLGMQELKALAPVMKSWVKAGNPAPHLFTPKELLAAADVFPLEIADIKRSHQVLFGQDLVSDLPVSRENLRIQLEHELKGKRMQLRQHYFLVEGNPRRIMELMVRSLSTFLVLFRGVLLFYQKGVPAKKMEAVRELAKHLPIQSRVFEVIEQIKRGTKIPGLVAEELFAEYLQVIESAVSALDNFWEGKGHV